MNHQTSTVPQVIPQVAYQSPQAPTQLMTESLFVDSGFAVPVFSPGDDPIACLNKMAGLQCNKFRGDKGKIILPKRPRNAAWYKEKAMLAKAQEAGQILDEEQLAFLADPGIPAGQAQTIIPHNVSFQTEDLDTYDSDCDDLSTAQAVLMANISNYGFDIIVENVVHLPSATPISLGMFKLDLVTLPPGLLQNREARIDYLRHTQEQDNTLREIIKQAKAKQHLDRELDFSCKHSIRIQELLVYVQDTCPNAVTPSTKKVAVSLMNKVKKVRFVEPLTSSSNIKQVESSNTSDSNTPVLSSTGVKCSTSNCGSKPLGNK
ncbi:hypothetical protein Tco_1098373 [Tanacetum coccineum]